MAVITMYNPSNQHMREIGDNETDVQARLEEGGFRKVEKYELVAVFNPNLQTHKTVLEADLQTWLNQGYYARPTWVYHPGQPAKMVSADEAKHLRDMEGWYDSPAKFPDKAAIVEKAVKELKGGKPAAAA